MRRPSLRPHGLHPMKRFLVGLVVGVLVVAGLPALASHINEPTTPVLNVELRVYKYPDQSTRLACDGSEQIDWKAVRIEADVFADGSPTEHWRTRVNVWSGPLGADPQWPNPRTGSRADRFMHEWNEEWRHQNVPPHTPRVRNRGWEFLQSNHYFNDAEGTFAIQVQVEGDASGVVLRERCVFERVN